VRGRLRLLPRTLDAALAVELEVDLGAFDPEGPAGEALLAHRSGEPVGAFERCGDVRLGLPALRLPVGEPGLAADDRAVELRFAVGRHLDREAQSILVRTQAAAVFGQFGRQHRSDSARDVSRERPLGSTAIQRPAGREVSGYVRDMHPPAIAAVLLLDEHRIVEVLGSLGVDREAELVPQVNAVREVGVGSVIRLELGAHTGIDEQSLEDGLDVLRLAENPLELCPAAARPHDGEVARTYIAEPLAVEHERNVRHEERLAQDELALLLDLDDEKVVEGVVQLRPGGSGGS
jgi:hypothetical protein